MKAEYESTAASLTLKPVSVAGKGGPTLIVSSADRTGATVSTISATIPRNDRLVVDSVRGEYGVRLQGGSHQTAFAFSGEKKVAGVTVQVGYAKVDPLFGVLNGDPYGAGERVFTDGSFPLPWDLTATGFAQRENSPPATSTNSIRIDLGVRWNVLNTRHRARAVPPKVGG